MSLSVNKTCTRWRLRVPFDVRFVSLGSRRSCTDRCHFALTSKSFLSIFDFGVNHSYFAPVMTKLTMLQIDVAPSIFTRFLSCLLRYHRMTRALLLFALH